MLADGSLLVQSYEGGGLARVPPGERHASAAPEGGGSIEGIALDARAENVATIERSFGHSVCTVYIRRLPSLERVQADWFLALAGPPAEDVPGYEAEIRATAARLAAPNAGLSSGASVFDIDEARLQGALARVPQENAPAPGDLPRMTLPVAEGRYAWFTIQSGPVFGPELAAAHRAIYDAVRR